MPNTRAHYAVQDQPTSDVLSAIGRALDLLRAFAMRPDHPNHKDAMLAIKGLLESAERKLQQGRP